MTIRAGVAARAARSIAGVPMLIGLAQPALAQSCWHERVTEAAQVRQFDIMLMVSALRCQAKGVDIVPDYNSFVVRHRATLTVLNDQIRAHMNGYMGGRAALDAYDRFGTVMANQFGNGGAVTDCEELRAMARDAATMPSSRESLVALAPRNGMEPPLPGQRCAPQVHIAQATVRAGE
ncbi:hypothetical protein [Sphingobium sp. CR28]|uniref:hypothetical protein n=1 Tax=Sphingobium sp. CR28 TaxID=3400272 RepID=UPI003FF051E6